MASILTPDQRLRVFVSSTLKEMLPEREAARDAITNLRLTPVMFELGARTHPPRELYRAYLAQSHIFLGVYGQSYGWVAPGEAVSGLEDEYLLSGALPKLIYVKAPAPEREGSLKEMLARIRDEDRVSYKTFATPAELQSLIENDLAMMLTEHFELALTSERVPEAVVAALPTPPTPLVGREQETEAVVDLLNRRSVRLVTLAGPGGVGKSRLALEVAARLGPTFKDGVRFVELASVTAPELVATTLAGKLGLRKTTGQPPLDDLKSYLRDKQLLLVLDNFEQVIEAAPLVAELLAAAPGVKALVTSRTVLRLSGEHGFTVPPLSLPEPGAAPVLESLKQSEAVSLFVQRAQAAKPSFELTDETAQAVAAICRRLDGLPLAIELAAARVRLLPPQALLARLGSGLELLTGGARDLPDRQRTLRSVIAWSFDLLKEDERTLFAQLGVFVGGFDLQAAEAIYSSNSGANGASTSDPSVASGKVLTIVEALGSLVDQNLVRQEEHDGEPRFGMLETLREYALERLQESANWRTAHDAHAIYYLGLAEAAEPELKGVRQPVWLERLEEEHGNLRAAMVRFLEGDQLELAVRLGWGVWMFWWFKSHLDEGARWFEEMLSKGSVLPTYSQARLLSAAGMQIFVRGDDSRAQALLERSLPLYQLAGDKPGVAIVTGVLGRLLTLRGDYARGEVLLEGSLNLYRELGDDWFLALILNFRGALFLSMGEPSQATLTFREGLQVSRRVGNTLPLLLSLYNLALSRHAEGELTEATALVEEGVSLSAAAGDDASLGCFFDELAALARLQNDPERAEHLEGAAEVRLKAAGSVWLHTFALHRTQHDSAEAKVPSPREQMAFKGARVEGRAMERGYAVTYALGKTSEHPREGATPVSTP